MKISLVVTSEGFRCATDEDYELKKTLKRGTVVECTIKEYRNYEFHKKYFSLISCAWEYLSEKQQEFFKDSKESFRKTVEISAGFYELVYNRSRNEWIEIPKSVAFDKLNEADFSKLYEKIKDVIYQQFILDVNKDEFEQQLRFF